MSLYVKEWSTATGEKYNIWSDGNDEYMSELWWFRRGSR